MHNLRIQRLCSWGGVAAVVVALTGLLTLAGFVPPPSPALDANAIAAVYEANRVGIQIGMIVVATSATLLAPFVAMLSIQMRRIEGRAATLSMVQLILGTLLVVEFILPMFLGLAATFRAERAPELVQLLNDTMWLMFIGLVCTAVLEVVAVGVVILSDKRENPIFPRWVGYFSIWTALLFTPGSVVVFFKEGPLAWNGLFTRWIPLTVFGAWFGVMTWALLAALKRQESEAVASAPQAATLTIEEQVALLSADVAELRSTAGGRTPAPR